VDQLLSPAEVAAILHVEGRTLVTWRYQRRGPDYVKIEGRIWYQRSALEAYVASRVVVASSK